MWITYRCCCIVLLLGSISPSFYTSSSSIKTHEFRNKSRKLSSGGTLELMPTLTSPRDHRFHWFRSATTSGISDPGKSEKKRNQKGFTLADHHHDHRSVDPFRPGVKGHSTDPSMKMNFVREGPQTTSNWQHSSINDHEISTPSARTFQTSSTPRNDSSKLIIHDSSDNDRNASINVDVRILSLNRIEFSWKPEPNTLEIMDDNIDRVWSTFISGPKDVLRRTKQLLISEDAMKSKDKDVKPWEDCHVNYNESCIIWPKHPGPYRFSIFAMSDGHGFGEDDDNDDDDNDDDDDYKRRFFSSFKQIIKIEDLVITPQQREPPSLLNCHWSDHHHKGGELDLSVSTKLVFSARDSLHVTCQIVGTPQPKVVWCRDKSLKSTSDVDEDGEQFDDGDDDGNKICFSWNVSEVEEIYSNFNFATSPLLPSSSSSSSSSPSLRSLLFPPLVNISGEGNKIVLSIKNISQSEHAGVWKMTIENRWGRIRLQPFEIDVAELPPFYHKDDWGLTVESGQSAKLLCRYVGVASDRLAYDWMRCKDQNDPSPTPVKHNERIKLSHDGSLIFVHTTPSDDGYYMCGVRSAHVDLGTQYGSLCKLTISTSGPNHDNQQTSPKLVHHSPATVLALAGQSVTLQCVFSGWPIPKTRWFGPKDDSIETDWNSAHRDDMLVLSNVTLNHEGSFKCRAENEDGKTEGVEFKVMVRELPSFVLKPLSVNASVGQNVSFTAVIRGQPLPKVLWFKNGHQMGTNQFQDTTTGTEIKSHIAIHNVSVDDISTLSCHLVHSEGRAVAWAQLNVFEPLRMTKPPSDVHVAHSSSADDALVRFQCGVESDRSLPVHLKWFRGPKVTPHEVPHLQGRTYITDGGTLTLNLTSFLGKLKQFHSRDGKQSKVVGGLEAHPVDDAVDDDGDDDEEDDTYYPYYHSDDIISASSIYYTCKISDTLRSVEASARLRLLPPSLSSTSRSTNKSAPNDEIYLSTTSDRSDEVNLQKVNEYLESDVMTQEVKDFRNANESSFKSNVILWSKNILGDSSVMGVVGGVICVTLLIATAICLVGKKIRRRSKIAKMQKGGFVMRNSDPSSPLDQIETGETGNGRTTKWVKPSRFGISPDARMCRHLGNMAEAGLYDDLQEMFVPRSRIKLGDCVGIGQFGRVFSALLCHERLKVEERVAVKTMKYKPEETEMAELFLREAVLMRGFKHPHVLGVIGVTFDPDGSPMVILPFMANGDMRTYIMNSKLFITVLELLKMSLQIACGMIYLSSIRFVHRDLAARNCMVDERGLVKVADFGLSRELMVRDYYRLCHNKTPVPVRWMALECLEANVFTTMSDVWSYGILLWELLTRGSVPYADLENWEVIGHVQKGLRPAQPAYCPDSVYQLMQKCWNPDPNERPTFQQLAHNIELIIESANALERCVQSSSGIEKAIQSATSATLKGASCRSPIYNGSDGSSTVSSQFNTFSKKRNLSRDDLELNLLPE